MMDKILNMISEFHIHPILVHFPIALFISAMGLGALAIVFKKENLQQASWINFILAVLITPFVVLTGLLEARHLHLSHRIADIHKIFAFWTFGISSISLIGLAIIKKKFSKRLFTPLESPPFLTGFTIVYFVLLLLISILILICGYYGGQLVYEYGVGVAE